MKKALLCIWSLLALFTSVSIVYGKGTTDKISITGMGLARPLEITNPSLLEGFSPWDGQFIDRDRGVRGRLAEKPIVSSTYDVFFYIKDNGNESRMIYAFHYAIDSSEAQGYIYLPTEGEDWHMMNSQTIARPSGWYYASHEWDKLVMQAFENESEAGSQVSLAWLLWIVLGFFLLMIVQKTAVRG